jgi:hypothetical protein
VDAAADLYKPSIVGATPVDRYVAWGVTRMHGESTTKAESLHKWTRAYMANWNDLSVNLCGKWTSSMLDYGDLSKDIFQHLHGVG